MTSYNRVILTGRVVTPPRRHYRPDGSPVIQFPLELNHSEDRSGQTLGHDGTGEKGRSLINIVAFGKLAELKFEHLQIGQHLLVEGRLNQRRWQTPEGKKRNRMEVIATNLRTVDEKNQILPSRNRGEEDEEAC